MEQASNSLNQELQAMAAVGQALDSLGAAARQRVLRWATERFAIAGVLTAAALVAEPATVGAPVDDPTLAVESLNDIFAPGPLPVDDTLSLEQFPVEQTPAERPPLETVIRSFAEDFQRFAEEWKGAAA